LPLIFSHRKPTLAVGITQSYTLLVISIEFLTKSIHPTLTTALLASFVEPRIINIIIMHFPLPGASLNIKACLVFILGIVSITYVTARPITGSELELQSRSGLISRATWTAAITFPATTKLLPLKFAPLLKEGIVHAIENNTPGHTVTVTFPNFAAIPHFDESNKIHFTITWNDGTQTAASAGVVRNIGTGGKFQFEVDLVSPTSTPFIHINSQPYHEQPIP
ncbi:hypothetical protein HHX47_DHR9000318, partial [Lentinula edodes]